MHAVKRRVSINPGQNSRLGRSVSEITSAESFFERFLLHVHPPEESGGDRQENCRKGENVQHAKAEAEKD